MNLQSKLISKSQLIESATLVAQKLIVALCKPFHCGQHEIRVSASIGVALYPDSATKTEVLLAKADMAMYEAKRAGKAAFVVAR